MDIKKIAILDTSYFIKLKPLEQDTVYYTTEYIIRELKDEKARNFYKLNKELIQVRNPVKDTMYIINRFAKSAGDLSSLSIPDISILALTYELYKEKGQISALRKEPIQYKIEKIEIHKQEKEKKKKEVINWDDDDQNINELNSNYRAITEPSLEIIERKVLDFVSKEEIKEVKINKEEKIISNETANNVELMKEDNVFEENDDDWITIDNIEKKLHTNTFLDELKNQDVSKIFIVIITSDFAVQNIALKMGILINSIDGIRIQRIKNYILKCYSCNTFNFDTSRLFCEFCGYTTLMKIGYHVSADGIVIIKDKDADARLRGTQYDIPTPTLDKKGKVYLLSEDQLPKRRIDNNIEKNFDKLIDNYFQYKDLLVKNNDIKPYNSSKNFVWGYPKKNPNEPKKYYSKKSKK